MIEKLAVTALAATLLAVGGTAFAGPAADRARAHFDAVASGDLDKITADYTDKSVFQWVGGPLDGVYVGSEAVRGVWAKFTSAQGKLQVDVSSVQEAENPRGTTVTANVVFKGKAPIPLRYVLLYREGKLITEIWQINPPKT